ncbi:putative protein kinase [Tribonema minus]|uniref:Protein kinase domain-containing protein n=1 Tax=Tribonema minus TaxID=303371 RepID=A0A835Z4G7_9STRA|nr:putative protein kinase [Tribonema minus]
MASAAPSSRASDDSSWPCTAEGYELEKQIGQGAFATVWKAFCFDRNQPVAIKIMDLENVTHAFEDIRQEVNVMRLCDHPNVVRCYCSFVHGNQLWLVMELLDKGSCFHVMSVSKRMGNAGGMKEDWIAYILRETLCGLQYFHQNGQIHRDIKAGNILLSSDGRVQLADFGVAGWLIGYGNRRSTTKTFVGTPCWMAPEVMEQVDGYNQRADIWSLGITALELAKGFAPYAKLEPMKVLLMTIEQEPPSLKTYADDKQPNGEPFSKAFREFVRLCLQKNPKKRPNCATLLQHSFFKRKDLGPRSLISELLNNVECVGESDVSGRERLRGTRPASFYKNPPEPGEGGEGDRHHRRRSTAAELAAMPTIGSSGEVPGAGKVAPDSHPAGTTWVFDDGSQVVLKAEEMKDARRVQEEENEDFFTEFEAQGFTDDGMRPK